MASLEPAETIQNLGKSDLEDLGLQCGLAPEPVDMSENLYEDVLRHIGGFARISQHAAGNLVYRAVIDPHQLVVCRIFIRPQAENKKVLSCRQTDG
jgi:hypothetical protein